jgi:DNA polymerase
MTFKHILWLDWETRSRVDLIKNGVYRYVACPDHRILIAGYALDNGPTKSVIIDRDGWPADLLNMLADPKVQIRAANAAFERLQLGKKAPPIDRWYCTLAQARAAALPGNLEDLGRAMGSDIRKTAGKDLIKKLSIPQADGNFCNDPVLMAQFALYCGQDVNTMRACSLGLPDLRPEDLAVYHASERINDRGLPIDTELCRLAVQYAEAEKIEAAARVIELSAGAVRSVSPGSKKLKQWVYDRLDPVLQKHMDKITYKKAGANMATTRGGGSGSENGNDAMETAHEAGVAGVTAHPSMSLSVDIRATLLELAEDNPDAINPDVVEMIEASEAGSMSSVAKFQTMLDRVSADGRLRGAFMFNGAYQTNRFSSKGAQVHNFPREVAKKPEEVLTRMRSGAPLAGVLKTLKSMLRPAIAPKDGKVIVRADWNAVEARGLPWLVDTPAARAYMAAFTDDTRDLYIEQAKAAGLGDARQPGKVVVLSLGYGGGAGALARMAKNYSIHISEAETVVQRWRRANPWVAHKDTGWWKSLSRCAMRAMENEGRVYKAGRVGLCMMQGTLMMVLPSGRTMYYPKATVVEGEYGQPEIAYLKAAYKPTADATEWPTARLWHGILAENADQAICADLLREALVRADKDGIEVIGHVHDEIITEAAPGRAKAAGAKLQRCMLTKPAWASDLPLKAEVDISPRFRK